MAHFLYDIPARLGRSNALDAVTRTLFMPSSGGPSDLALLNYTRALRATRTAVLDSNEAFTADTVCALYFFVAVPSM